MVRFMDRLNEKMEVLDEKIQNKAAKAGEDYLSFFESHAEEAYKEYYLYKCFRDLRKKARESGSPEKVLEYLKKRQNVCLDTLLRQDIAARSTSPMADAERGRRAFVILGGITLIIPVVCPVFECPANSPPAPHTGQA